MAYINVDQYVTVKVDTDDVISEIDDDVIVQTVIDRGLENEILEAIDNTTIVDYIFDNNLEGYVLNNMEPDDILSRLGGNFYFDPSTVDDDDLLNEVRQRNLSVVLDGVVVNMGTLVGLLPKDAVGKRFT